MVVGRVVAITAAERNDIELIPWSVPGVVEGEEQFEAHRAGDVEGQLKSRRDTTQIVGNVERESIDVCFLSQADVRLPIRLSIIIGIANLRFGVSFK